jgi:TonB-linked SusC/RagA family outer membrane protein
MHLGGGACFFLNEKLTVISSYVQLKLYKAMKNKPEFPCRSPHSWIKRIIAMKFILMLTAVFALACSANTYAQKTRLSVKLENATILEIFQEIEKSTEFGFFFKSEDMDMDKRYHIDLENVRIDEVLALVLKEEAVDYTIEDRNIILTRSLSPDSNHQPPIITGTVTDAITGEVLPGVNIVVKGTTIGTITDVNGKYNIEVPEGSTSLTFSFLGMESQEIIIGTSTRIDVSMVAAEYNLKEVIVIGYGTQQKKDLTGAIAHIGAEQMGNTVATNAHDYLLANIPGLNASLNTSPEGGGSLLIRGKSSLSAGTYPLLVVDGVIFDGDLIDINPSDIEAIDVLKDASSAAVYGAKSANGVVLITTKKGKSIKPNISFKTNVGIANMAIQQRPHSPESFLKYRQAAMEGLDVAAEPYKYSDPRTLPSDISVETWLGYTGAVGDPVTVWLQRLNFQNVQIENYLAGKTVDWYDEVFQNGVRQDYTLSLSGKKEDISYYMSLEYMNNEGLVVGEEFNTIRGRLNLEGVATKFLTAGINMQFADRDQSSVPAEWERIINNTPYGSMYNDDGTLKWSPDSDPGGSITWYAKNPFNAREYTDRRRKTRTIFPNIYVKGKLPLGFSYRINFNPSYTLSSNFEHLSSEWYDVEPIGGKASRSYAETFNWQIDNIIGWNHTFKDIHHFDVTLLANAEKFQSWYGEMYNERFVPDDNLGYHSMNSGTNAYVNSSDEYSTGDALMARLNYSLKERYFLTLSVRRDGYSAFGQLNPRATFPAAALGWVFSDEDFLSSLEWLNFAKLRFSYGINGNRDIGRYQALSDLQSMKYINGDETGKAWEVTGLYVNRMSNAGLRWEQSTSYNLGLDFSVLNNRLHGYIDTYIKSTSDLLVLRSLPDVTGFSNVMDNLGEVQNKGIELNLNSRNIDRPNFLWRSMFNFSLNRNKIIHLYGPINVYDDEGNIIGETEPDDPSNWWFIGQDIDVVWDIKVLGVWQVDEIEEARKYGFSPGDFKLEDVNNDGIYTDEDRQFLGYYSPRFRWSFSNYFTFYKNFDFSFMIYSNWGQMDSFGSAKNSNWYPDKSSDYEKFDYWTPENPINDFARLNSSSGGIDYTVYRRASFIRLQNVSISYNVPKILAEKAKIDELRVYFNIRNALVYAPDWVNWDPEHTGPTPRYYTLGLDFAF